jgi:uncharacterized membrane protein
MEWLISVAHWFGSAVCDQLPLHSYHFADVALPLCARCTGLYLGALLTLTFHAWRRPRAVRLPRPWMLVVLLLFFCAWAGDGANSFLSVFPGVPQLYPSSNLMRLITGTLMGITIGSLVFVMFNSLVWRVPNPVAILATRREFLALLGFGMLLVFIIQSEWDPLLYPVVAVSLVAILTLHMGVMTALAVSLTRRMALTWREVLPAFVLGALVAVTYLSAIALLHAALVQSIPIASIHA